VTVAVGFASKQIKASSHLLVSLSFSLVGLLGFV